MRYFACILLVCMPLFAAATRSGIQPEAAQRDFRVMNAIFARSHATAFRQIPARDVPELFTGETPVGPGEFIRRVMTYYGSLHVDHTMVGFTGELVEEFGLKFFPLPLKFFGGRAYADVYDSRIPFAAELQSVNGKQLGDIVAAFSDFPRERGKEGHWDAYYLGDRFSSWYFASFPQPSVWQLQFAGMAEVVIPAEKTLKPVLRASTNRPYFKTTLHAAFIENAKAAYFAINSFMPAPGPFASLEKWMDYFRQFDAEARRLGSTTLILDLRENPGGLMPLAASSACWFIENPVVDLSTSSVHTRLLPYREFAIMINGQKRGTADFDSLEKSLQSEFSDTIQNGYFATKNPDARHMMIVPESNIHRYRKIFVLIGPKTYSAGVFFARLLKLGNPNVVLAGSETGSPGDGHAAEVLITYRLPESGIYFDVPLARVRFAPLVPGQKPGKGLMPDLPVIETLADFRAGRDTVLETVIERIAKP